MVRVERGTPQEWSNKTEELRKNQQQTERNYFQVMEQGSSEDKEAVEKRLAHLREELEEVKRGLEWSIHVVGVKVLSYRRKNPKTRQNG